MKTQRSLYTILTKGIKLWRNDNTKENRIWASKGSKWGEGPHMVIVVRSVQTRVGADFLPASWL